eukprot:GILI01025062.1.p2 GENE.GILI01025062.1~~GILI01025062.1.p2  ORF type:complete len:148 (+),score=30.14 GILI01025062.1:50-493(+)
MSSGNITFVTEEDIAGLVEEWDLEADRLLREAEELPTTAKWANEKLNPNVSATGALKQNMPIESSAPLPLSGDAAKEQSVIRDLSPTDPTFSNEARYRRLAAIHQSKVFEQMMSDAMQTRTDQLNAQRSQMAEVNKIVSLKKAMRGN